MKKAWYLFDLIVVLICFAVYWACWPLAKVFGLIVGVTQGLIARRAMVRHEKS